MSMSDPTGDMLARIHNALAMGHSSVECRSSKINSAVLKVMLDEGYIRGFHPTDDKRGLRVMLKYYAGKPAIEHIKRISRPGLRRYSGSSDIEPVLNGMGISIVSTSSGVMTDHKARKTGVGGEVICQVY